MVKYFSTVTNEYYRTAAEAEAAEHAAERAARSQKAKASRQAINLHIRNFESARSAYLERLAALQKSYSEIKANCLRALRYHDAPTSAIKAVEDDGIVIDIRITK